jgi:hypothetical protein
MLNVIMLSAMLNLILPSFVMLKVIMLSDFRLNVIMLGVVILSVVAPQPTQGLSGFRFKDLLD